MSERRAADLWTLAALLLAGCADDSALADPAKDRESSRAPAGSDWPQQAST